MAVINPQKQTMQEMRDKKKIEETAEAAFEMAQKAQDRNRALEAEIKQLKLKVADQENRDWRQNLRLRFFKETDNEGNLKQIVLNWFQELCPNVEISMKDLDQVHHLGKK
ncbi:hypothetical protein JRQ81_012242 [Phrynocephalus forsythii]|uniref:Uncharacterized protein n=1 Tax=Phrynocephalus forsythii TaxID=171643 RepID=A0A9Q1APV5_9SAUR|nr:hypothetical protein JRQ81_012242 [Phrynocephalus forsythii]